MITFLLLWIAVDILIVMFFMGATAREKAEMPDITEWAIAHGYCPVGTTKVTVTEDGAWICE